MNANKTTSSKISVVRSSDSKKEARSESKAQPEAKVSEQKTAETKTAPDADLAKLKAELRAKKEQAEMRDWEESTHKRNPAYVRGSLRRATEQDLKELEHCHGLVCTIKCVKCGTERTINKQDAFQVQYCETHRKEAVRAKAKEKRQARANSPERLAAQRAKLQAKLASFTTTTK